MGSVPLMKKYTRQLASLAVVAIAAFFSVATTGEGGADELCGGEAIFVEGGLPGDPCVERGDCNEVCCLCDDDETVFIAQGCDFEIESCLSESALCAEALDEDPSLCEPLDDG